MTRIEFFRSLFSDAAKPRIINSPFQGLRLGISAFSAIMLGQETVQGRGAVGCDSATLSRQPAGVGATGTLQSNERSHKRVMWITHSCEGNNPKRGFSPVAPRTSIDCQPTDNSFFFL
jgi:hypothetical protein